MIGLDTLKTEWLSFVLASFHRKIFLLKENDEFTPNPPPPSKTIALLRKKSRQVLSIF